MSLRIYTSTPRAFLPAHLPDSVFFSRDMGLTCYALRAQGVDSRVVMPDSPTAKRHPDILRTTLTEMEQPEWWCSHELDAVVLGSWADPAFTPVARAVKDSGARLILRCDSGGAYSQWQKFPWQAFYANYLSVRYAGRGAGCAAAYSLLKTPLFYVPAVYEKGVITHMSYADLILIETPEGARLLKSLCCRYGRPDVAARVQYVPHPVAGRMGYAAESPAKSPRIIAVGRWNHYSKNVELMMRSLGEVLCRYPEYEADIYGAGEDVLIKQRARMPATAQPRIHIRGVVEHEQLSAAYQQSRILFAPSRSESFNIAAAEALACGCSLVGSGHIFSFQHFVSKNTGTLAATYNVKGMINALSVEMSAWEQGLRDPGSSAQRWTAEVSSEAVARFILDAVHSMCDWERAR